MKVYPEICVIGANNGGSVNKCGIKFIFSKGNQIRFDLQNGVKFTVSITIFLIVNFLFFSILSVRGM